MSAEEYYKEWIKDDKHYAYINNSTTFMFKFAESYANYKHKILISDIGKALDIIAKDV